MVNNINQSQEESHITTQKDAQLESTKEVLCRVFFVRHGEVNSSGGASMPNNILSIDGIKNMDNVGSFLKKLGCDIKDTLLLYSDGDGANYPMLRITQSKRMLNRHNIGVPIVNHLMDTTEKVLSGEGKVEHTGGHPSGESKKFNDATQLSETILNSFKSKEGDFYKIGQENPQNIKNIILLGHKSNNGLTQIIKKRPNSIILDGGKMSPGDICEIDIYNDNGNIDYMDYSNSKNILFLNHKNISKILYLIRGEESIRLDIESFFNKELNIFELQNLINNHFGNNPELYIKYITSDNEDLRAFCLANLINLENYKPIEDAYLINKESKLSTTEKEILLKNHENNEIKSITQNIYLCTNKFDLVKDYPLFQYEGGDDFYVLLNDRKKFYDKTVEIQKRSLDKSINDQKENSILTRKLSLVTEIKIEEGEGKNQENDKKSFEKTLIDADSVVEGLSLGKKYVLPAHVGSGKSIWSSELTKKMLDKKLNVKFFEGKDFNDKSKVPLLDQECDIIVIDAIDEINYSEQRANIKSQIKTLKCGVLLTSRLSEYNDSYNEGFETLSMQEVSKKDFIYNKIPDAKKADLLLDKLDQSNLTIEVEGNPLLLNFVCMLYNDNKLDDISNKSDLYEKIINLILSDHQKSKPNENNLEIADINWRIDNLSEIAFYKFKNKDSKSFIKDRMIREGELNAINMLFKKSDTDGYDFIHKSFEEYFLARYLANQTNGAKELYDFRDDKSLENKRNDRKDYKSVIRHYGEILINNNQDGINDDKINDFLGENGLLANDDAFGYNFSIGLEIISHFPQFKMLSDLYIKKIKDIDMYVFLNLSLTMDLILKNKDSNNTIQKVILEKIDLLLEISQKDTTLLGSIIGSNKIMFILSSNLLKDYIYNYFEKEEYRNTNRFLFGQMDYRSILDFLKMRLKKLSESSTYNNEYYVCKNRINTCFYKRQGKIFKLKPADGSRSESNKFEKIQDIGLNNQIEDLRMAAVIAIQNQEWEYLNGLCILLIKLGDIDSISYLEKPLIYFYDNYPPGPMDDNSFANDFAVINDLILIGHKRCIDFVKKYADMRTNRSLKKGSCSSAQTLFWMSSFIYGALIDHQHRLGLTYENDFRSFISLLISQGELSDALDLCMKLGVNGDKSCLKLAKDICMINFFQGKLRFLD